MHATTNLVFSKNTKNEFPCHGASPARKILRSPRNGVLSLAGMLGLFILATPSFAHAQECVDTQPSMGVQTDGLVTIKVFIGSSTTLSSPTTGATYTWKKDGAVISGQTSSTLIITAVSDADSGEYSVAVDGVVSAKMAEIFVLDNSNIAYEGDRDVLYAFNNLLLNKGTLNWDPVIFPNIEDWDGVGLENCRVTNLELRDMGLIGTLPEDFGDLSEMKTFNIFRNSIAGELDMSRMQSLREVEASNTDISDFKLGSHPFMRVLTLGGNQLMLHGKTLDLSSMPNLKDLRVNRIGLHEILWSDSGHNAMRHLLIQDNDLIGTLDLDIMPNLINVQAQNNQFTDLNFSVHTAIEDLRFVGNPVVGTRTFDISQLKNLKRLYLSNLNITAIELGTTVFPRLHTFRVAGNSISDLDLGLLPALRHLQVQNNQLGGIIEVANAANIDYLNISSNEIEGACIHPTAEAKLATKNRYYYAGNPCENDQCSTALTCPAP